MLDETCQSVSRRFFVFKLFYFEVETRRNTRQNTVRVFVAGVCVLLCVFVYNTKIIKEAKDIIYDIEIHQRPCNVKNTYVDVRSRVGSAFINS